MADFLAIYHLRINPEFGDLGGLSGFEFLRYATRLPAYRGAVANELHWAAEEAPDQPDPAGQMVPADQASLLASDLADLIDFG
ncbi:MAG TPA: hypothetical protein VHA75_20660 [Rugosimonospora sp.]|nr:hypothetical protein [Rugosimonospora sp.]